MAERSQQFTGGKLHSFVITITATATTIGALIKASTAGSEYDLSWVNQVIIDEKVTAGSDRAAILVGHAAGEMNKYYAAGQPCDPPVGGTAWLVKRAGGSDVTATATILLDS